MALTHQRPGINAMIPGAIIPAPLVITPGPTPSAVRGRIMKLRITCPTSALNVGIICIIIVTEGLPGGIGMALRTFPIMAGGTNGMLGTPAAMAVMFPGLTSVMRTAAIAVIAAPKFGTGGNAVGRGIMAMISPSGEGRIGRRSGWKLASTSRPFRGWVVR